MPGPKYGEFTFPATVHVKGYARGGPTRPKMPPKPEGPLAAVTSTKPNYVARAMRPGLSKLAKGGPVSDVAQDKAMIKAAVHKHERNDHPGKPLTKLAKGGVPAFSSKPKVGC